MNKGQWLLLVVAGISLYLAGVVWLMQISGYPLWIHVGAREFAGFYAVWSRGMWLMVFAPMAIAAAGSLAMLGIHPPGVPAWTLWLTAAIEVILVVLTVAWWNPPAAAMLAPDGGLSLPAYAQLMDTHWVRVALVTFAALLLCAMLSWSLWPERNQCLLLATFALAMIGLGHIWPVQLLCYRLWTHIGSQDFYAYHVAWWHSIWSVIFLPAGLLFVCVVAIMRYRPPGVGGRLLWSEMGLQLLLILLTAIWFGPLMARLATRETGLLLHNYHLLMATHWVRVAIVTGYTLVAFLMVVKSAVKTAVPVSSR